MSEWRQFARGNFTWLAIFVAALAGLFVVTVAAHCAEPPTHPIPAPVVVKLKAWPWFAAVPPNRISSSGLLVDNSGAVIAVTPAAASGATQVGKLGVLVDGNSALVLSSQSSGLGSVTSVTGTPPIASSGGNTPAISCAIATGSVAGCLAAADFTTFNAKQPPLSTTTGLTHQFIAGFTAPNTFTLAQPLEDDISFSDITTNNASTSKHGYVPKLPNDATKFFDGTGNYSVPAGGGSTQGPYPLENGVPDGTGNVFYNSVAFTSPYVHAHWEFDKANTVKDLSFRFRYPHVIPSGTAKIILGNVAANDATASHTMTFKECDKQVSTIENPGSYTCTATQNFTTTSTAYAPSDITFTLNDTPTADKEVEIYIECTATSGLSNNVLIGGVYLEWQ